MAIMGLTGTVTNGMTTLTSAPLNGQVVTFTGNLTTTGFTGSYSITGGCDSGDQGSVTGVNVSLTDADGWYGTFTSSAQKTFTVTGNFAQGTSASPEGSLGITGTATFNTPCFSTQTISAGSFPTGSFLLGTLVSLEIDTNNGTLDFVGYGRPEHRVHEWDLQRLRWHLRSDRHSLARLNRPMGLLSPGFSSFAKLGVSGRSLRSIPLSFLLTTAIDCGDGVPSPGCPRAGHRSLGGFKLRLRGVLRRQHPARLNPSIPATSICRLFPPILYIDLRSLETCTNACEAGRLAQASRPVPPAVCRIGKSARE